MPVFSLVNRLHYSLLSSNPRHRLPSHVNESITDVIAQAMGIINESVHDFGNTEFYNPYLDTWSGFEAAKTAPWPNRGLLYFSKFLEPSDE